MTKDEALQMCLEYIETNAHERRHVRWAIKEALAQPEQGALKELRQMLQIAVDRLIAANAPATEVIDHKAAEFCEKQFLKPSMFLQFVEPEERYFCQRCGKRTADLTTIHTCTPPKEKNT